MVNTNRPYKFEVGDRVTVASTAMLSRIRGLQRTITGRQKSLQDNVYDVAVDGSKSGSGTGDYGIFEFNLEPAKQPTQPKPDPEQPQIFTSWQEAQTLVNIKTNSFNSVRVASNMNTYRENNIFLSVGGETTNRQHVVMSVEEAKAVAVALFNQILWHEQEAKRQ